MFVPLASQQPQQNQRTLISLRCTNLTVTGIPNSGVGSWDAVGSLGISGAYTVPVGYTLRIQALTGSSTSNTPSVGFAGFAEIVDGGSNLLLTMGFRVYGNATPWAATLQPAEGVEIPGGTAISPRLTVTLPASGSGSSIVGCDFALAGYLYPSQTAPPTPNVVIGV